jgi:RNA polymerase sigma factor (sigma-70 family)
MPGPWRASEPDHAGWFADRDELDRALDSLPIDHRAVIVLKHYAGLSNAEISKALGVPEGTVRSRLHHAHRSLRAAVAADARPAAGASAS